MIRDVSTVNADPESCCYLDEGWVYDGRIEDFDEVATRTIDRMEGKEPDWTFLLSSFSCAAHPELPSNIWVAERFDSGAPRMLIQRRKQPEFDCDDTFGMTISDTPDIVGDMGTELTAEDIAYFKRFVVRNKPTRCARRSRPTAAATRICGVSKTISTALHESFITPAVSTKPPVGRNDPCPCGSGLKYKKCCGKSG